MTLASAGMQRVLMLAYLLVWAWHGHVEASKLLRQTPTQRLVILFDEPETHLHPQWQRRLLPALLTAIAELHGELHVQTIVCTHSPLVLASMEPYSDQTDARLFTLSLSPETRLATIDSAPLVPHGDVLSWLLSDSFGLQQARSVPAEEAIEAAKGFMRGEADKNPEGLRTKEQIHARLSRLLNGADPFWPRWIVETRES